MSPSVHCILIHGGHTWKQLKWPLTDNWLKKMWRIYTMEYYSAIRKDKILQFVTTQMDLEIIMLSKIS